MSVIWIIVTCGGALAALVTGLMLFTTWNTRRAQQAVPPTGHFINLDGVRMHYLDQGSGPVIVMVHGLGGNLRNFYRLVDVLSATFRVVAVDRPGSGYSVVQSGPHPGLNEQASIVAQFIRALDLQQPVLVGHSLGGALALALALDHPGCVRALVLVAPLSQQMPDPPPPLRSLDLRSPWQRRLIAWLLLAPIGRLMHRRILRGIYAPEPVPPGSDVQGGGALGLRPSTFTRACLDLIQVSDDLQCLVSRYAELEIPVEVVFGRQDPVLDPYEHGERLAELVPGARVHLIDGGHMILVTAPQQVARHIHLADVRSRGVSELQDSPGAAPVRTMEP
jgi:pimeloyl-ACP methyl ester carboxylesterase